MPQTPDEVSIGNFDQPVVPTGSKTGLSPVKDALDSAERQISGEMAKDEAALKPMQSFADRLKEAGITLEKAGEIVDAVMMQGFYSEEIKITSRIKARLRSRGARDIKRIQEILEVARHSFDHHYREALTRLLLAASLEQFGNDKLPHAARKAPPEKIEEAFRERILYVDSMAEPALQIMFDKLFKFDRMITAACAEGTIENF